jgi:hypothetical protein
MPLLPVAFRRYTRSSTCPNVAFLGPKILTNGDSHAVFDQ